MSVQLKKGKAWFWEFYERGGYVAHNRDVRYSPTHSVYSTVLRHTTTKLHVLGCKQIRNLQPVWPVLVAVATH